MTSLSPALRWRALAPVAVVAVAATWLAMSSTAQAASDLQIPRVDCQSIPRKIAVENLGDSGQDLTGWKLQSDKPGEEFDLSPIGALAPGATVYVFNGDGSPEGPLLAGSDWIYPWDTGSLDYALWEDGSDFIQLNDPAGFTVSHLPCPIPPVEPSPSPSPEPAQPAPVEGSGGSISTAKAASNLQIPAIDCQGHPRRMAIENSGDSAQSLTGWKLQSDKPGEVFDLSVVGQVGAGETFFVFNGHMAPLTPLQIGGQWIYGWNPSETLIESLFVLWEDGYDFVAILDAGGNEVFRKPCPIPFGWTPTPQPTQPPQQTEPPGATTGGSNTPGPNQTDGAVQNVPGPQNTGAGRGAQARGPATSGEQFGPPLPASDSAIPSGGGPPPHRTSLPMVLMSLLGGAAVTLGGLYLFRQAIRRPGRNA